MTEHWIATRRLTAEDGGTIEVSVGIPCPSDTPTSWQCPIRYVRNGQVEDKVGSGEDAFQALYNALGRISLELECKGYSWSPGYPGWANFPRVVGGDPTMVDLVSLYKMIDDEMDRQSFECLARNRADRAAKDKDK